MIKSKIINTDCRPTSSKTMDVLTNVLLHNHKITHTIFTDMIAADLCCGTGTVGFQLLSIGFKQCYFIDNNPNAIKHIVDRAVKLSLESRINTLCKNIEHKMEINDKIDLIFLDPPYDKSASIIKKYLSHCEQYCSANCTMIIEAPTIFPDINNDLFHLILKKQVSNTTQLLFFRNDQ